MGAVVDLRGEEEARLLPHPLADLRHYRLLPLVDPAAEALRDTGAEATFGDLYSRSLERNRRTLALVFGALADLADLADRAVSAPSAEAVLVCCAAGRDRTGMVAALLLDLAGVEREAVVDDYHRAGSGRPVVDPATAPPPRRRGGPDIDAMLDHVHARWGGSEAYLWWLGLDDRQVTALRSLLRPTGAA
ncbi:tyrosine-protein phosphatase [Quadrisphaera oryzae]|uniref:tyrosine-protein phosphatase n=1 Tax=Quadrisphaera TaxID=317661 RepID=UPI0016461218|nr:tyrosine-protein phosphatase [Quadrisphaera sp. RL12-1S]